MILALTATPIAHRNLKSNLTCTKILKKSTGKIDIPGVNAYCGYVGESAPEAVMAARRSNIPSNSRIGAAA